MTARSDEPRAGTAPARPWWAEATVSPARRPRRGPRPPRRHPGRSAHRRAQWRNAGDAVAGGAQPAPVRRVGRAWRVALLLLALGGGLLLAAQILPRASRGA